MKANHQQSRGFSLIECLVYMSLVFIIAGAASSACLHLMEHSKRLKQTSDQVIRALQIGEIWRKDIRRSTGPITLHESSGNQSLHIPIGSTQVIYRFNSNYLERFPANQEAPVTMIERVQMSHMIQDQRGSVVSWRWELELQSRPHVARVKPHFTFQAVPPRTI